MPEPTMQPSTTPIELEDEKTFSRIGLIVLATDLTSERDLQQICNHPGIRLHTTRIAFENPVNEKNYRTMQEDIALAAGRLVPETPLDAIYFSCTSATAMLGQEAIEEKIRTTRGNIPLITPLSAAIQALETLEVERINILTPYTAEVSQPVSHYFARHGVIVDRLTFMGLTDDREMARISHETIVGAAHEAMSTDAQALFISCTALRSAEIAGRIEQRIGRPIITSNQAAAWQVLRNCGLTAPVAGYGRLLSTLRDDHDD